MTIYFITGGYGFLGQYIVKAIHDYDSQAELRVLVRTPRETFLELHKLERVTWIRGELTRPETFTKHLMGVDTVIHNAAMVSFSPSKRDEIINANIVGTRNLAQESRVAGIKNFIFISSISAVEFRPPLVTDESFIPDLDQKKKNDIYGYTKRVSEIELTEMKDEMRVIILNPSVILGPGSERVAMAIQAAKKFPFLPMLDYINAFVDVRDVANAVVLAQSRGRSGERYLVTAYNIRMVEFTRTLVRCMGKNTRVFRLPRSGLLVADRLVALLDAVHANPGIRRPSQMNIDKPCSSEKIKKEMDWQPRFTLEDSIADSIPWSNKTRAPG